MYSIAEDGDSPDHDKFDIQEEYGQLYYSGMVGHMVDFEEGVPFYQIKVTVTDDGNGDNDEIIVIIKVTDVNEPPMFTVEMVTHDVLENTMAGYPTNGLIIATDPERDAVTYRLANAPGSTDAASFTIDDNTGQLRVKAPLDYETKRDYRVIVHATDNKNARGTSDDEVTVTITVTDVNEKPMFTEDDPATRSILEDVAEEAREDFTIGAPIVATDPEMAGLIYGLAELSTLFEIDSSSGQLMLQTNQTLNYEGMGEMPPMHPYTLMVNVHDGFAADGTTSDQSPDDTITVTVTVENVNEPPTFGDTITGAYVYAGKVGNVVHDPNGVLKVTDPDENDTLIYRLTSGAENFSIDSGTGVLTTTKVLTTTPPTQSVTVTATDRAGRDDFQTFAITVQATTETAKPAFSATETGRRAVDENKDPGENIESAVAANDLEDDDKVTYSLGGTDKDSFDIDSDTGQLKVKDPLDFETKSHYTVIVMATDGTSTVNQPVTITVNNVDEAPVFTEGDTTTRTIPETPVGTPFAPANVGLAQWSQPMMRAPRSDLRFRGGWWQI